MERRKVKNIFMKMTIAIAVVFQIYNANAQTISLAGQWRFKIDSNDVGIKEQWFNQKFSETVLLPGSMLSNNKGNDLTIDTKFTGSIYDSSWYFMPRLAKYREPGNLHFPFWLTPNKYYIGPAWYSKEFVFPTNWDKQNVHLFLERVHTISTVWIDGKEIGTQNSLATAHEYDCTAFITPGKHTITIRLDNRIKDMNVGPDSHSVTDHTQGNWNGIIGKMELRVERKVYIKNVQVYPDVKNKTAKVLLAIANTTNDNAPVDIALIANSFNTKAKHNVVLTKTVTIAKGDTILELLLPMTNKMLLWSEFDPALYNLMATVFSSTNGISKTYTEFGMRSFGIEGTQFTINGQKTFLRGTVNNCEFPLTGFPPTDVAAWQRLFAIAKAHGLNHMRFHSWCPPEAAFDAADREGFYLQPEVDSWPNHGTSLGDGRFIDKYIYEEAEKMLQRYGNHPSFAMLAAGNEPAGRNQAKYLKEFILHFKSIDNRHLYTGASVAMSWPLVPENEYMIKSGARGLDWNNRMPENDSDYHRFITPFAMPYVTHEQGQWCVFPDFKEIKQYTGNYRAKNFEMFQQDLAENGMGDLAEKFLMASGKLQSLCYKFETEKSLRTPGLGGFQLLGLQDFPGQGSAIVGTLNAFWKEKGYTTPQQFKQFCNVTVPLIRTSKFVYTNDETLQAAVEIYHYGKADINNAVVNWKLVNTNGAVFAKGKFAAQNIPTGKNTTINTITIPLAKIINAQQLSLQVTIENTNIENNWNFWVYPKTLPALDNASIYYTDTLDAKAVAVLDKGGKVFLNLAGKIVKGKEVVQYFTPVFWNTSWFKMRPPHTLGILVDEKSPAFASFPTSYYSNLQWWEIVNRAQVMHLENFPKTFQPLIRSIDTWFMNRRLAMLFEARCGNGKIIVSSANLSPSMPGKPAATQLFYSLQSYMLSNAFAPTQSIDINLIRELTSMPSKLVWDAFTKAAPDELKPKTIAQ
ncbi:exo-beta-1,4-galactosidase [Ferruginibacter sp. SUN106]|uniref:exo-beta-1,4-galactosidase n=1 Tax=Ferruginibacter sp. SUN106 TaxID=2978348 RepID=UPI003D367972